MKKITVSCKAIYSVLIVTLLGSTLADAAAVPVEDIGRAIGAGNAPKSVPIGNTAGTAARLNSSVQSAADSDPYYRMQLLMEELRQLRGLIEEQSNELALIKKRQAEDYLDREVVTLLPKRLSSEKVAVNWSINHNYHFGGFAKQKPELSCFMRWFEQVHGVALDPVYNGKMLYGLWGMLNTLCQNQHDHYDLQPAFVQILINKYIYIYIH